MSAVRMVAAEQLPRVLPHPWRVVAEREDGCAYRHGDEQFTVIASVEPHEGALWLHVSCARRDRLPTWDELKQVKDIFIGRDKQAIQVLPPASEYVNIHPHCLHLWRRVGVEKVVPNFARGGLL